MILMSSKNSVLVICKHEKGIASFKVSTTYNDTDHYVTYVINVPTIASLPVKTKDSFFSSWQNVNIKRLVCKQRISPYCKIKF